MDILNQIKERRSCRSYQEVMPKEEEIHKVIEAGLYAASGMNLQTGIVIAITNKDLRAKLSKLNAKVMGRDGDPFYGAPVVLLIAVKKGRNATYDGACMIENMMLEASSLGLGSCWIHRAKEELAQEEGRALFSSLNIDLEEYEGVGHVILGYPSNTALNPKEIKEGRVFYIK